MEAASQAELEALKYSQLQRLAKAVGLKANLKADKLLNALKQHFKEAVQEDGNMVNQRSSSSTTDTEELNSSQIPVNTALVTKRRRKRKGKEAQRNLEDATINELLPEEETQTVQEESWGFEDAGFGKTLNQNSGLADHGPAGSLAESSTTPSQLRERNSTSRKRAGDFTPVDSQSGKKCRYPGKTGIVPTTTPNFKKLHEAQFKKMKSIDEYIERKHKMIKNFNRSVNEVKMLAKESNDLKTSQKATLNSTPKTQPRGCIFSPHSQEKSLSVTGTPISVQRSPHNSLGSVNKSILSQKSAFSLTSLSTTKMNVRFSESTRDNEHKRSLTKTPSRKSPFLKSFTPESQQNNTSITNNLKGSSTKCPLTENASSSALTPFKFSGQTAEPTSTKKPVFDLQASLSRPLGYQPHRGKLKPWGKSKENISRACSLKKNYKQPLVQTREERRDKHDQGRKQRKDQVLGTRRGVTVA